MDIPAWKIGLWFVGGGFFLLLIVIPVLSYFDHRYEEKHRRNLFPPKDYLIKYSGYIILYGSILTIVHILAEYLIPSQ